MRILHIDTGAEMRGGQHQVLLLLEALRDAGHEPVLLARAGGPLLRLAVVRGFQTAEADLKQIWQRSKQADIVHAHDARAHTLAAIAAKGPLVVSRRVAFPLKRSLMSRWKYKQAVRYMAVSRFVAGQLQAAGIGPEKIDVVYDAVPRLDAAELSQWQASLPAVALGLRDPLKGRDLVERAGARAGIPVIFSQSLPEDLRRASMLVYITRSEGLGSAALLAMEMGVPVIASRVGGLTEVFTGDTSGIFVENNEEQIAEAMQRIIKEPGLAERLIAGGRSRIREQFTRDHLLNGTLASYRRALGLA